MAGFVNLADESKPRITPEQAGFQVARVTGLGPELHGRTDPGIVLNDVWQTVRRGNDEPFIGVDVKNPAAAAAVKSVIPRSREIAGPSEPMKLGPMVFSDFNRSVRRTGINNDDLVDLVDE